MKIIFSGLAAAAAIAAAGPAAAQYRTAPPYPAPQVYGYGYRQPAYPGGQIERLMDRIERGYASGAIGRGEAADLRNQLLQYGRLERQYARNGFSDWERRDLDQRMRRFREDLREVEDGGYRGRGGYGEDRYDDDRYDDRRYDRYDHGDRWEGRGYDDDDR